jgi:hypothetical protein
MANRMTTVPLPLTLHLAGYTVIGLFCLLAGVFNLLDPSKYIHALAFFAVTGLSWGYVFGIYMARREVVTLGFGLSAGYAAFGVWQVTRHPLLGLLLLAIGVYGCGVQLYYRKLILEV